MSHYFTVVLGPDRLRDLCPEGKLSFLEEAIQAALAGTLSVSGADCLAAVLLAYERTCPPTSLVGAEARSAAGAAGDLSRAKRWGTLEESRRLRAILARRLAGILDMPVPAWAWED